MRRGGLSLPVAVVACGLALFGTGVSFAQPAANSAASVAPRMVLVELFTSEGCSSCPPADDFLERINDSRTPSGIFIVGLSEHVTYWDDHGWKDPYSAAVFTDRQDAYRSHFRIDSVYTPQAVINGESQVNGSDRRAVLAAIEKTAMEKTAASSPLSLQLISANLDGGALNLRYALTGSTGGKKVDVFAVVAADAPSAKILKGENAGHELSHAAVARSIDRIASGVVPGAGGASPDEKQAVVKLKHAPVAAPSLHVVLFAQASGTGPVLAVATAPLPGTPR